MKEKAIFRPGLEAEGRVCIQYTDPLTQKVKEEIKGKNHVYTQQLLCKNWQSGIMQGVPLCITDGRQPVNTGFPIVPGILIGYGMPTYGSSGTYRGAYRGAGSYLSQPTTDKLSSKFIYDFGPTQALGQLGHIGLSYQTSYYISEYDTPKENVLLKNLEPKWAYKTNSVLIGSDFYATSQNQTDFIIEKGNLYNTMTESINLSSLIDGPSDSAAVRYGNFDIGYDPQKDTIHLLVGYRKTEKISSSTVYTYYNVLYGFNRGLTQRTSRYEFITAKDTVDTNRFAVYGRTIYSHPFSDKIMYACDIYDGSMREIPITGQFEEAASSSGQVCFYENYMISLGTVSSGYGFIFDLKSGEQYACATGYDRKSYQRECSYGCIHQVITPNSHIFAMIPSDDEKHPIKQSLYNHFAITDYRVPDNAPARPAGYGMTITYELEVFW